MGDEATSTLTIENQKSTAVKLRNAADPVAVEEGDFTVTKALAGDGDFSGSTFEFSYTCTDGTEGTLTVTGAATSEKSKKIKAGSTCTVTENGAKAAQGGYTLTAPDAQTVTIAKDQTAQVTMTNTYARDMGTFSVTKSVTGAEVGDKEFTFSYTCDNNAKDTLKVKADGAAVSGPQLPVGTKCTITEDAQAAQIEGHTLEAPASQEVTIGEKNQVVSTTFTNTYPPKATPSPSPSASESPTPGGTPDPSESSTPAPSESPSPDPSNTPDPSDPATPGDPSSPNEPPQAGPSDPPVPDPTPGAPGDPSGNPLASTGVRIGLPLAVAVFAVMGGALLVSRRRA